MNFKKILHILSYGYSRINCLISMLYIILIVIGVSKIHVLNSLLMNYKKPASFIIGIFSYILASLTSYKIEIYRQKNKKSNIIKPSKKIEQKENTDKENNRSELHKAFFRAINEQRKDNPLIGAKMGSKEIFKRLIKAWSTLDSKGVHMESILCILGSLAGYSCHESVMRRLSETNGSNENLGLAVIETTSGKKYLSGDLLNEPLVDGKYSVWSLTAGAVKHLGINELINIDEIFIHTNKTMGAENYGILRMPEGHNLSDTPYNYVKYFWNRFLPILEDFCSSPSEWPILYGLAIQEAIIWGKDAIDPLLAISIVMESAVPMSKIDIDFAKETNL